MDESRGGPPDDATSPFPGFHDVQPIARGGVGTLYRAVRTSTGGIVALKELQDVGGDARGMHRARRELDALLRLKGHPGVVSVEEIIAGPRGPCLVMEFAVGGSLIDRLRGGPLTAAELVYVVQQVGQALQAAHDLGIVHRDVKPHNLLVGAFGQVKVCDFGIAALTRGDDHRTMTQALTLAYASPEELDGAADIGPATDVYSLAASCYHLASGAQPGFRQRDQLGATTYRAVVALDHRLDELARLLFASLATEPRQRPPVSELVRAADAAAFALGAARINHLAMGSSRPSTAGRSPDDGTVVARPPERPPTMATTEQSPGWYPDPSGRYELRFWDGTHWTEHASTAGQRTTDDARRAAWMPDPWRRHELRYWDGAAWTAHVSDQGVPSTDG